MSLTLNGYSIFLRHNSNITNANKRSLFVRPLACPSNSFLTTLRLRKALSDPTESLKEVEPGTRLEPRSKRNREPCLRMLVELLRYTRVVSSQQYLAVGVVAFQVRGHLAESKLSQAVVKQGARTSSELSMLARSTFTRISSAGSSRNPYGCRCNRSADWGCVAPDISAPHFQLPPAAIRRRRVGGRNKKQSA